MTVLSTRVLNRTFLHRQLLAERIPRDPATIVERLVAVQGQEPDSPYLGMWARSSGFQPDDLAALLHDRTVVRAALLRGTQHLCTADDYLWLRPTFEDALVRMAGRAGRMTGCDPATFEEAADQVLAGGVLTRPEIARRLAAVFPGVDARELALVVHLRLALLHPPPAGLWGHRGRVGCVPAESWLGRPLAEGPRGEELVRRYLAAFGPASVKDFQTWSGLTRASGWFAGLPTVKDEKGTILYDLPGATIADGDVPAPVVFLPEFDNAVLGHADRARVIRPGDRPLVMPGWSIVRPTVLVDGFVEATWSIKGGTVTVAPFRPLAARAEVEEAALRLAGFVAPEVAAAVEWV